MTRNLYRHHHAQSHHLILKGKNPFNLIEKTLSDVDADIDLVEKVRIDCQKQKTKSFAQFFSSFYDIHHKYNLMKLIRLLDISNKKIRSENYSRLLNQRIIELIIRLNRQASYWIGSDYNEFSDIRYYLTNFLAAEDFNKVPEYAKLVDNAITKIVNFDNVLNELVV